LFFFFFCCESKVQEHIPLCHVDLSLCNHQWSFLVVVIGSMTSVLDFFRFCDVVEMATTHKRIETNLVIKKKYKNYKILTSKNQKEYSVSNSFIIKRNLSNFRIQMLEFGNFFFYKTRNLWQNITFFIFWGSNICNNFPTKRNTTTY